MYGEEELLNEFSLGTGSVLEPMQKQITAYKRILDNNMKYYNGERNDTVKEALSMASKIKDASKIGVRIRYKRFNFFTVYSVNPAELYKPADFDISKVKQYIIVCKCNANAVKASKPMDSDGFVDYIKKLQYSAEYNASVDSIKTCASEIKKYYDSLGKILKDLEARTKSAEKALAEYQKAEKDINSKKDNKYMEINVYGTKLSPKDALSYYKHLANIWATHMSIVIDAYGDQMINCNRAIDAYIAGIKKASKREEA